jgi:hypothetical protein
MIDICDLELVGLKLEKDSLTIHLTKEYFQQQVIENNQAGELLKNCAIANLVGTRIVRQAIDMKMAKEVSVKKIDGVPFLMIFKFQQ